MRRGLIVGLVCIMAVACVACNSVAADTVATGHSLNDEQDYIDYKVTQQDFQSVWEGMAPEESAVEFPAVYKQNRNALSNDSYVNVAKAYLIENNVLSRPVSTQWSTKGYETTLDESWMSDESIALKSDVYTMLYKAVYGVLDSRVLVLQQNQDYYLFKSPDVYELYLEALLDKGLINKSDLLAQGDFLKAYEANNENNRPVWYSQNGTCYAIEAGCLGQTFTYSDAGIQRTAPSYFQQEDTSMLELLGLIEQFMRFTEKDMTTTEANIVAYKYGVTYLAGLTDDEYNTVSFLIAKGILNPEEDEFNYFGDATYADVYKLVYRVANKDARYDFSEVQLTDGEAFWQAEGFGAENFDLVEVDQSYVFQTESVSEVQNSASIPWVVSAASSTNEYTVVKVFDKVNAYTYRGKSVAELISMSPDERAKAYPEITSEGTEESVYGDGETPVYKITFKIQATSAKRAVQIVDSKLTCNVKDATSYSVSAITKITKGNKEVRLISQSALRKCFGSTIEIVEDKVLRNVNTGAMACLLQDSGYALVGNEVVTDRHLLVTDASNDVYYNLDVIASLLGTTICNMYTSSSTKYMTIYNSGSASLSTSFDTNLGSLQYLFGYSNEDDSLSLSDSLGENATYLYNVNQVSSGINTLWRKFYYDYDGDGDVETFVVVVDWYYCVPGFVTLGDANWFSAANDSSQYTLSAVFSALYKEPTLDAAKEWWQSNLGISNAFANMIFDTKNVEYVKCGYMVPSLKLLLPKGYELKGTSDLSQLMVNLGFSIPAKYKAYVGGSTNDFIGAYYNDAAGLNNESTKTFAKANRRWMVYQGSDDSYGTGTVYGKAFYLSDNGVLWRSLDEDYARFEYTVASDYTLSEIKVRDRLAFAEDSVPVGTKLLYKNKQFYYAGTYDSGTGTYLKLVPLDDQASMPRFTKQVTTTKSGRVSLNSDGYQKDSGYSSFKEHIEHFYEVYFDRTATDIANDENLKAEILPGAYKKAFCTEDAVAQYFDKSVTYNNVFDYYLGYSDSDKVAGTALFKNNGDSFELYVPSANGQTCNAIGIPYLYLPAGDYYMYSGATGDYTIGRGVAGYALNMSNLRYSGIIDGVIDSILAKSVNTTEISNLSNGTQLLIGDTVWTKSGSVWVSDPIKSSILVSDAKTGNTLTGLQEIFSSEVVANDGVFVSLAKYVKSADLAAANLGKLRSHAACVCKNTDGTKSVYIDGEYKSLDTAADYAVVQAVFDDSMLVRAVSADGSIYRFCNSATESIVAGTEYPFFNEQLSYSAKSKDMVSLSQSSYEMTAIYNAAKDKFNAEYKKQWFEDFATLIRMIIVLAASWLMVISWIVYWTVSKGIGVRVLEALAGKSRFGKNSGVDLVKLVSFGMYNLDSPPVFTRIFIVSIICVIIDAICLALG